MDHQPKCEMQTIKFLEDNTGENLWSWVWWWFLDMIPKAWSMKWIMDKLDFIKIKNFSDTIMSTEWADVIEWNKMVSDILHNSWQRTVIQNIQRTLQTIYCLIRKWGIWLKNEQKALIDTSPKKIYRWQIIIWKDAQHHMSFRELIIKATVICHHTTVRIAKIQNTDSIRCCWM